MTDSPLRILTLANVPPDPNSGAAGTVYHTNVALRELGHEVDELWAHDLGRRRISHGNLHSLLEQPRLYRDAVLKAVSNKSYDVVQMSQPQAWLAARDLKSRQFQGLVMNRSHGLELRVDRVLPEWHRRMGIPESKFPRSLFTPALRHFLQRQWWKAVQFSDGVIVTCEMDRDFLIDKIPAATAKTFVVHHGVAAEFVERPPRSLTPDRLSRLLYVGQHSFIKGYHILVQVLNRVLRENEQLTCTWVTADAGHGEIRSLIEPTLQNRLHLENWRPNSELIDLYDQHGQFVFPSFFEGAGKASLEALSRQMYVVASDTGAMHEYITANNAGALCPVGDVEAFAGAILRALSEPQEAIEAAVRGREIAAAKSWRTCAERLVEVYRTLQRPLKQTGTTS
ncbi:MAG: glycosyltransferase family 4 protein [Planctomycetaceae bacterium]|nr:glycosyltransferase family 4 protein [Planctomycetaceae bacterium]